MEKFGQHRRGDLGPPGEVKDVNSKCQDDDAGRWPETASAQAAVGQRTVIEEQRRPAAPAAGGT